MAKLSAFRADTRAIESGEWIAPGEEFDDLEILTRGYTDAYRDAFAAATRKAGRKFNGDTNRIPSADQRSIMVDALIEHVVLDVRNLADDDGNSISIDGFRNVLRDPAYPDVLNAVLRAAAQIQTRRADDFKADSGN